MQMVKFE